MTHTPIRVRIAPSPTGEPHIGLAYTALVNEALIAQNGGGQLILRIEDTDQTRSTRASETSIYECMKWLGFMFDESPEVGGPYGPYRQTDRRDIYQKHAAQLEDAGHAFTCFCTPERLDVMRTVQRKMGKSPKYDGHCLSLSKEEVATRKAANEPHVLRMKIPTEGTCTFTDGVYGEISIPWADVDMQVIMKADGLPTYHLAVVVDDHLMKITHTVRGEEWISSTPKHIKLYEYFGWDMPKIMHLPVLRNPDRTKLSKRKNHTSIRWFQAQGYIPEAMINFLGQSFVRTAEGEEELMTRAEFHSKFTPTVVSKAGAVFDLGKLDWFNGRWLREKLDDAAYLAHMRNWATLNGKLDAALLLARSRIVKLSEATNLVAPLFAGSFTPTLADYAHLKTTPEETGKILTAVTELVGTTPTFTAPAIWEAIKGLETTLGLKARVMTAPLFIAIGGKAQGLPLTESMELLGRAMCQDRLRTARDLFAKVVVEEKPETEEH
ncbi:MAG: glutamate--tRNA ligase [Alphaproteobacteria bacterium]